MTGKQHQEDSESTLVKTFPRRMRRNALADIFENPEDREKFMDFLLRGTHIINLNSGDDIKSMLIDSESEDSSHNSQSTEEEMAQNSENLLNRDCESTKVLSLKISQDERLGKSNLTLCRENSRPSCLTNICTTSSTSTCKLISSSSNFDASNLSPSAEMLTINFPDESASDLLSPDANLPEWFTVSRNRRNALHDLLETLTEEDREKLKSLYQNSLANTSSYSFRSSFSDLTQGSMSYLHQCTA